MSDQPFPDELNDWLCQLLDQNFQLICEDDSCYEVARHLCELENLISKKDQDAILSYVRRLPQSSGAVNSIFNQGEESSDDERDQESPASTQVNSKKESKNSNYEEDIDVEDGWSVVRK